MALDIKSIGFSSVFSSFLSGKSGIRSSTPFRNTFLSPSRTLDSFRKETGKITNFVEGKPDILFICDYIVDDEFVGILIVFERYQEATHYEIFKDNKFDNNPQFERILFLDSTALEAETKRLLPYLRVAGFELNENSVFAVMDDNIKKDRIYEFFVRAAFVPKNVNDLIFLDILKSKNKIKTIEIADNSTISSVAFGTLGGAELSWIIALLNNNISFFGKGKLLEPQIVSLPKDPEDIMKMINDSIFLFGAKKVLNYLLSVLGGKVAFLQKLSGHLNEDIASAFSDAIDEVSGVFSFDVFKSAIIKNSVKSFGLLAF